MHDFYILRFTNIYEFAFVKFMSYYSDLYARKSVKKFAQV